MVQKIIFLISIFILGCASIHENISYQHGALIDLGTVIKNNEVIDLPLGLNTTVTIVEYNQDESYIKFRLPSDFLAYCEDSYFTDKPCAIGNKLILHKNTNCSIYISSKDLFIEMLWGYQYIWDAKHIILIFNKV